MAGVKDSESLDGIRVQGMQFSYEYSGQQPPLFLDFNLNVSPGFRCLLEGANESGKTTMLKILAGKHIKKTLQHSMFPPKTKESIGDTIVSLTNPTLKGGVILEKIMGLRSTGHLELLTNNPNDNPSVTFNYFKDPEDLRMCVEGTKTIIDVINSNAFSKFRYHNVPVQALIDFMLHLPMNSRPKHSSAAYSLEQYCIDTVLTIWHFHGGCQSGKVVDHNYKVIGVEALRVIDGSTFHRSPGTNPQATVMMLGRYMEEKILKKRFFHGKK